MITASKQARETPSSDRRILIVDDDADFAESLGDSLELHDFTVRVANDVGNAISALESFHPVVALLDIRLGTECGLTLISEIKSRAPATKCVMITGYAELDTAIEALQHGADDYLCKPVTMEDIVRSVEICAEKRRLEEERERAERALRSSEARLRAIINNSPAAIFLRDLEGRILVANRRLNDWCENGMSSLHGLTAREFLPENLAAECEAQDREVLRSGESTTSEVPVEMPDGSTRWTSLSTFPVLDVERVSVGLGCIMTDVTGRRRMEDQLRQAQKMEAVGQLTGGIAHDFNNLLLAITLNLELLKEDAGETGRTAGITDTALMAAGKAADLTQRLLAFSCRQPLSPIPTDVNEQVRNVLTLIRRTIGEDITVKTRLSRSVGSAIIDPGQLENAIMNLALNARDAMPDGGRIMVRSDAVALPADAPELGDVLPAGDYVRISVSDTGCGMNHEVVDRAIEPFFTTKEVGAGSGLGLSMVFGFMKQSDGHLAIESEPDRGTTVMLFLPASSEPSKALPTEIRNSGAMPRGDETIMVVEDDDEVRRNVVQVLEALGYSVIAAGTAREALDLMDRSSVVHLVFSDVVLPGGMNGWQLVEKARERRPEVKVLLTSGYTGSEFDHRLRRAENVALLPKPYNGEDLAVTVRGALDEDL